MDMDTGMLKHEVGEMNRRVSGCMSANTSLSNINAHNRYWVYLISFCFSTDYNPPVYEMRKGTQNSHATLVDPRTGQLLPSQTELQRNTAPCECFRTQYQPWFKTWQLLCNTGQLVRAVWVTLTPWSQEACYWMRLETVVFCVYVSSHTSHAKNTESRLVQRRRIE